jgi:ribose 5-phosphate isomerase A
MRGFAVTIDQEEFKRLAAERAVEYVKPGMIIGLGGGSTARWAMLKIAALVTKGTLKGIRCVPCSMNVGNEARRLGIPLADFAGHPAIDITIDGADEATASLELIKGGGGALLHEKIVARASRREIIVIDESKLSPALGVHCAVPVEVIPFGWRLQADFLQSLGAAVRVRKTDEGEIFRSDEGNMILDCNFGAIERPEQLAVKLNSRTGIVEHGLFVGVATELVVAGRAGLRIITLGMQMPEGPPCRKQAANEYRWSERNRFETARNSALRQS